MGKSSAATRCDATRCEAVRRNAPVFRALGRGGSLASGSATQTDAQTDRAAAPRGCAASPPLPDPHRKARARRLSRRITPARRAHLVPAARAGLLVSRPPCANGSCEASRAARLRIAPTKVSVGTRGGGGGSVIQSSGMGVRPASLTANHRQRPKTRKKMPRGPRGHVVDRPLTPRAATWSFILLSLRCAVIKNNNITVCSTYQSHALLVAAT